MLALSKAFALAAASDAARQIRDEVGFFQAIRAAMAKTSENGGKSSAQRDLAIQQIVSRLHRNRGHHEGGRHRER